MTERDTQGGSRRPADKRSPEEIEAQIHETKSAIGEDIKALGERLSPEHLREGAKAVMHDAREEAKGLIRDVTDGAADTLRHAKDRAVDTLRTAKDNAVDTVTEVADEVGTAARRAGTRTAEFVTTNGVPLTLIGLGVGWLALSMRRQRGLESDGRRQYGEDRARRTSATMRSRGGYGGYGADERSMYDRGPGEYQSRDRSAEDEREGSGAETLMERAEEGFDAARDRVKHVAEQVEHRAEDLGHRAAEAGREMRTTVGQQLERVRSRAAEYSQENPVALGAVAIAAGVGVGLLLPTTEVERQWMGRASSRLVDEARGTAERVGDRAKSTAREVRDVISEAL